MIEQCVWCKIDIADGDSEKVWIERQKQSHTEYEWQGVFCGDEHASMWVAKPFDPDPVAHASDSWQDTAFTIGCITTLLLFGTFTAVGLVFSARWVLALI